MGKYTGARRRGTDRQWLLSLIVALTTAGLCCPANSQTTTPVSDQIKDRLRNRIETAVIEGHIAAGDERIFASFALPQFYERRGYAAAWSEGAFPRPCVDSLIQIIKTADQEGLHSKDYHLAALERTLATIRSAPSAWLDAETVLLADLDLLATDAFLIFGSHLLAGRVNPVSIDAEWFTKSRERDIPALLDSALQRGDPRTVLTDLLPNQRGYFRLRERLREYRRFAAEGGWPEISSGPALHPGDRDPRTQALRRRLGFTRDLPATASDDPDLFDDSLAAGVVRFQRRHGLEIDTTVGPKTLAALNVSAADRAQQIAINLERWRWLPEDLGAQHILVNIANFELEVIEAESTKTSMKVIVGRPYRRTPVFTDRMTYLVLNPYWNIPPNLAVQDIIPAIRKSPGYLSEQKISVFQGWGESMRAVDPAAIDWSRINKNHLPFWFRQEPGPLNSLGRIKFMFPNPYNVYLHDTPKRELFAKSERGFSSGCIRIQRPIELADYLLAGDTTWTPATLRSALDRDIDRTVTIPRPMPIHILYWTAWVTSSGTLNFREDIYKRDIPLAQALAEPPPAD